MSARRALARPLFLAALAVTLAAAAPARGQGDAGLPAIPAYTGYVTDVAGVIDDARQAQLEAFLDQLEKKTGVQFAVLTVASTAPEEPSTYKTRAFQQWGIGRADQDDGLLLLVAMEQRTIIFETGYGLEGTLPDGWQSRMVRDLAIPRFRAGEPAEGITAAVLASAQRIAAEKQVKLEWNGKELRYDSSRRGRPPLWVILLILFVLLFIVIPAIGAESGRRRRGIWGPSHWGGGFGGFGGGFGGGGSGGSSGGGSFGGFGGGSSGGGGGRW